MEDFFGSVRRSLVFRATSNGGGGGGAGDDPGFGGFVEKIGSSIRKSRIGLFSRSPSPLPLPALSHSPLKENMPPMPTPTDEPFTPPTTSADAKEDAPPFRWRKGELIGCGGFGRALRELELILMATLAVQFTRLTRRFSRPSPTHVSRSFQLILKRHRPTFRLKLLRNRCVLVGNSRRPFTVAASSSSEWNKNVGKTEERYGIIVVGGGHAGCEAALAFARIGAKTLLLTLNLDRIAWQ